MAQLTAANEPVKKSPWVSVAWVLGVVAIIITCLVLQQSALLYVLSTIGVTALLIVVGRADLTGSTNTRADV